MAAGKEFKQRSIPGAIMYSVALMAALFSLVISTLLIADHVRLLQMDPLNDPVLLELRSRLANAQEGTETLVEQIRTYDFYARRAFFGNAAQRHAGGWLLLGGATVCFLALKLGRYFNPKKPLAGAHETINHNELNALFRQLMAGTGILLVVVALFFAFAVRSDLAAYLEGAATPAEGELQMPVSGLPDAFLTNWPSLRGPGNIGKALAASFPVRWDIESGEGVRWKTKIEVHGFNSPIVWNDRIYLTGADDEGQEVFCYDSKTGDMLWTRTVESSAELPEVSPDTGYAAPTMATDGTRVFAIFASGDLSAFDLDGNPIWQINVGRPDNPYGMGSSLISDGRLLFVQYDHEHEQKVMAFNGRNGELEWETARDHISWSSPALIETDNGMLLILNDGIYVRAYDPATGREQWQVECLGGEMAPSPAFNGKDILFVANEYAQATALRLTADEPAILWQYDDYLPEISSPLATASRIYIATSAGDIICLDAEQGEVLWEQEFEDGFNSSPILAGGKIYAPDLSGVMHIFDDADAYHAVADVEIGEAVYATPAYVNGRIYVRGDENLYCIGE